jgi:transposase
LWCSTRSPVLDLDGFRCWCRADGHGRAVFDPAMMVALLLYGYCQGERSSRQVEWRCVRDVGYRVIVGERYPDQATIARFRARHETALGGLFSQVLRLLAAGGMVRLGKLSLDGTMLAGTAAQAGQSDAAADREAADRGGRGRRHGGRPVRRCAGCADAADDRDAVRTASPAGRSPRPADRRRSGTVRRAARHGGRVWDTAAAAGVRRGRRPADDPPRPTAITPTRG